MTEEKKLSIRKDIDYKIEIECQIIELDKLIYYKIYEGKNHKAIVVEGDIVYLEELWVKGVPKGLVEVSQMPIEEGRNKNNEGFSLSLIKHKHTYNQILS